MDDAILDKAAEISGRIIAGPEAQEASSNPNEIQLVPWSLPLSRYFHTAPRGISIEAIPM